MNLKQIDFLIASLTASKVASILENTLEKILFRKHWYNYFPFFTKEKVEYSKTLFSLLLENVTTIVSSCCFYQFNLLL